MLSQSVLCNYPVSVSGNKVSVCYDLCIRHTTERTFVLHIISEFAHCYMYFHIKGKCFTNILSYAAYNNH